LRSGFVFALELWWFAGFAAGLLQRRATKFQEKIRSHQILAFV
jgi:hypothetical protein